MTAPSRLMKSRPRYLATNPPSRCTTWEVIDDLGSGTKLFCPPEVTNNLERVRVIVAYIEARPERMKDGFGLLANEAMAKAWPCKN